MSCFHVWFAVNETTLTRDRECFRTRSAATSMTRRHPDRFPPESPAAGAQVPVRVSALALHAGGPWSGPELPGPRSSAARSSRPVDDVAPPGEAA